MERIQGEKRILIDWVTWKQYLFWPERNAPSCTMPT
jgi:hypothetical protein